MQKEESSSEVMFAIRHQRDKKFDAQNYSKSKHCSKSNGRRLEKDQCVIFHEKWHWVRDCEDKANPNGKKQKHIYFSILEAKGYKLVFGNSRVRVFSGAMVIAKGI